MLIKENLNDVKSVKVMQQEEDQVFGCLCEMRNKCYHF